MKRRDVLLNTIRVVGGLVCAALVWNLVLAFFVWRPTGYVTDPALGRIYRAGLYVEGTEGFSWSWMNHLGMRGAELHAKRPAERRVLFLGDSFTEALQVPERDAFTSLVAAKLASDGIDATSVDAGRSGASPANYIYLADWYKKHIAPDAVVVQLSDQDFTDDLENHARNFYVEKTPTGYRAVFNRGFVSADRLTQSLPWVEPLLEVPLVRVAADEASKLLSQGGSGQGSSMGPMSVAIPQVGSGGPRAGDPRTVDWVMDSLAKSYDRPVILYVPDIDYFGDPTRQSDTERAVLRSAVRHGLTVVDDRADVDADFVRNHRVANGFDNTAPGTGHLNAEGHELVASRLAPVLQRRLAP